MASRSKGSAKELLNKGKAKEALDNMKQAEVSNSESQEDTEESAASVSEETVPVGVESQPPKPETLRGPGRPRKETTIREPGNRKGLQPGQERFTVVAETELLNELRDYAYTERITLRAALDQAMRLLLKTAKEQGITILKRPT